MRDVPEVLKSLVDQKLQSQPRVVLAIDGPCGGGKSTLGKALKTAYADLGCELFHMDDFFLTPDQRTAERLTQPGGNVDRERFLAEVLQNIVKGEPFTYRRFDCQTGEFVPVSAKPGKLSIVEGAYALHPDLRQHYGVRIFLDIKPKAQLERLRGRVGEEKLKRFTGQWIPLENRYFDALNIRAQADIILQAE